MYTYIYSFLVTYTYILSQPNPLPFCEVKQLQKSSCVNLPHIQLKEYTYTKL